MMATKQKTRDVNLLLIISLSAFLFSCSKIRVKTPSSRFISPEAQGKLFNGQARLEQQGGTEGTADFAGNRTDNPMELRNNASGPAVALDLGLLDQVDFIIKGNYNAATVYTVKYQIMGDSRMNAKKGNQSLAVSVGYGYETISETESDSDLFDNDNGTEAEIEQSIFETSLIYGYRPQDDTLIYTSVQATKQDLNFELTSDTAALNGEKFSLNTWAYGLSAGAIRYFDKYFLNLEVSAQSTDWNHNDAMTYAFLNLALGYKWD